MPERSLSWALIFSIRHITSLLSLGIADSTSAPCWWTWGGSFEQWDHKLKHRNAENETLDRMHKGHLLTVWELQQEGSVIFCDVSWDYARWVMQSCAGLSVSTNDLCKGTVRWTLESCSSYGGRPGERNSPSVLFRVILIFPGPLLLLWLQPPWKSHSGIANSQLITSHLCFQVSYNSFSSITS